MRKYLIQKCVYNGPCISTELSALLPDPALEDTPSKIQFVQVANERAMETIEKSRKRTRGHYTSESRAKITKWACEHGNKSAAKRFS